MESGTTIHPTATIGPSVEIGPGTAIWHHAHLMEGVSVGARVVLGHAVFVGRGVRIGDGCRVQNHVSLFEGVVLEKDVFVGPSATFTNVKNPRAFVSRREEFQTTTVRQGATIGANATVLPGLTLGRFCFVGAGAVVTRDVPDYSLALGTPARVVGWMSRRGVRLEFDEAGEARCAESGELYRRVGQLVRLVEDEAAPQGACGRREVED